LFVISVQALLFCFALPLVSGAVDPLAALHELASSAPRVEEIEHLDRLVDQAHPVAHAVEQAAAAAPSFDTSFAALSSQVHSSVGTSTDSDLAVLGSLSTALAQKKAAVESQRLAILSDETKLQRLRRLIAENREILTRNEQALATSSNVYLGAVQHYTEQVNQAVVKSLQATQDAAQAQVASITGAIQSAAGASAAAPAPAQLGATDDHAVNLLSAPKSLLATASTSSIHAAQAAEAHLAAEHAAEMEAAVTARAKAIGEEYTRDLAAHKAKLPTKHQREFAEFTAQLKRDAEAETARARSLNAALNMPVATEHIQAAAEKLVSQSTPSAAAAALPTPEPAFNRAEELATAEQEMQGEPVTMFFEMEAEITEEPATDAPELTVPKIEEGVVGLPEEPEAPKPDLSKLAPCPADAKPASFLEVEADEDGPTLTKPTIEEGVVGLPEEPEAPKPDLSKLAPCPADAPAKADAKPAAFVEVEGDAETESESEVDSEADADAEVDAEADSEFLSEVDAEMESEMDADLADFQEMLEEL
jgi:hypothetical protein